MAQTILHKRSATASNVPSVGDLSLGELAINTSDGKLFFKKDDGSESIVEIGEAGVAPVTSVFGRSGAIVAQVGDYSSFYLQDINAESIGDLADVSLTALAVNQVLRYNGSNFVPYTLPDKFLQLTDTPSSFSGQGTKVLAVNSSGNAVEFITQDSITSDVEADAAAALAAAQAAQTDADTAQSTANGAQSDATQALSDAAAAQSTANTALSNAGTAQSDVDALEIRVGVLETIIDGGSF